MLEFIRVRIAAMAMTLLATVLLSGCPQGGGAGNTSISASANTTAQSLTVGTPMTSFSPLTPIGGALPYLYSFGGTLPAGLSLNASTGAVTGTPTATYASANIVFSVQDAKGVVANTTSTVRFTVGAASPSINATANTTAQSLTVGTAMSSFSPLTPSGGTTPYIYSVTSGVLPAGLHLDSGTGAVTGTPSATYATANVVFSVRDANQLAASTISTVSFTVQAASPSISATATTTAQNLTVGIAMASFSPLTPSGGAVPYAYSISAGALPAGLSLDPNTGAVTGTPGAVYTAANVVFAVMDANQVVASTSSTVSFAVQAATPAITATADTTAQNLTVGIPMTSFAPLTPSGGATPYTYSLISGTLPSGLSLDTSTGAVSGTPGATYSSANLVFTVTDANSVLASTSSTVSFTVAALPAGFVVQGGLIWMPVAAISYTHSAAVSLCATAILGSTGWRLPVTSELYQLPLDSTVNLASDGWTLNNTWTSTTNDGGVNYDGVNLSGDFVNPFSASSSLYVTCVR